jgi:signal transduction histidine kinase
MTEAAASRIFIVDDDRGLLRLIEKTLQREGFATATASSGTEALDWLGRNHADLTLLDLKLPDLGGKDLIQHLDRERRSVPFIIITGQGDERVAVEMMKRGALDYLVKDVQFIEFVPTVVRRALAQIDKDRRLAMAEEEARRLQKEILDISENEQRRIGRDLHDGLGQHLTALELLSQTLVGKLKTRAPNLVGQAQDLTRHIRETVRQTRLLSHNLSPVAMEADGLMIALSELAAGTRAAAGLRCDFICPEPVLLPDAGVATHLYRIAQEAVNNALKHSGAKTIEIRFAERDGSWEMCIEDDGRGLPGKGTRSSGLGLRMMKYRAQLIGATLEISLLQPRGVRIVCLLRKPS